ncbi:hypothetical protein EVAR_64006_1 [Eumeta japonica]|uniref:Uncharacterized protein n=1 Tax=Eumeta variegata TaxID=151549 RepID=A0A4C1Z3K4_EUMVA|nr:hypothetical protein EVAR_64006_1 [Eumeta japonica]
MIHTLRVLYKINYCSVYGDQDSGGNKGGHFSARRGRENRLLPVTVEWTPPGGRDRARAGGSGRRPEGAGWRRRQSAERGRGAGSAETTLADAMTMSGMGGVACSPRHRTKRSNLAYFKDSLINQTRYRLA